MAAFFCVLQYKTTDKSHVLNLELRSELPYISVCVGKVIDKLPSINNGLNEVNDKLKIINDIISKVDEASNALNTCIKTLAVLADGASALSVVPIIGSFATILSKVLKSPEESLKILRNALNDIKKLAKELKNTTDAAQGVTQETIDLNTRLQLFLPGVAKTVIILDYVIQIAEAVEPMAAGIGLCEKIEELKSRINETISSAEKPVSGILDVYNEFSKALEDVKAKCREIENKTAGISSVVNSIKKISDLFMPVGTAIKKAIDAIAPIKWVIKAADCLINKLLNPVVNTILKETGLQELINELDVKIKDYLGFNKIIEEVTSVIGNIEFSHKLKNIIGFRGKIDGLVADINKSLGEFSPVGNNLLGESLRKMLGELFDARIDLEKPAVIIDWAEFSMPNTVSDYCCRKAKREPRIIWNQDTELRNKVFICDYYENVSFSDGEYPLCLELAEKAGNITEGFSKIVELHNKLSESVCVLHNAAHLPALFKTEVQSVSVYFEFLSKTLDFFSKLKSCSKWSDKLSFIEAEIKRQSTDCTEILTEIDELYSAAEKYQEFADEISSLIKAEDINAFVVSVNTYACNLHVILDGFALADEHKPEESKAEELEKLKSKVLENTKNLSLLLDDIKVSLDENIKHYETAYANLTEMLSEYRKISPDGYILPENITAGLEKTAGLLSNAQGIFDPLELLLEALQDYSGSSNENPYIGLKAKNMLSDFSDKAMQGVSMENVCNFLESLSPIFLIKVNLRNFIDGSLIVNEHLLMDIKGEFQKLCGYLSKRFTYNLDGENIENNFFTEESVNELTTISFSI